jgi:phosphonate degradation associated HDIG domain protein
MSPISKIRGLFDQRGHLAYGEGVTELQHALQSASLAEGIVAALLHDIGHLLHGLSEDVADQGIDGHHERIGEKWLEEYFGPEISQPVRLHVAAKRYQCTVNPDYLAQLSPASTKSFVLQGDKMNEDEVSAFEKNPFFKDALQLRTWDDNAKDPEMETPFLEHYLPLVKAALVSAPASQ